MNDPLRLPNDTISADAVSAKPASRERPDRIVEPTTAFPSDAFPAPVRKLIELGSNVIGCDPSFVGLPVLAVLASCIGNTTRVQLKRAWVEPGVIWCAVVARSGALKSPPMRLAMRPMYEAQRRAMSEYRRAQAEYQIEKARFDVDFAAWKKSKVKDSDPPVRPDPPVLKRVVTADVTIEALGPILASNPRGTLVARPELSAMLGGFGRYSGARMADAAAWLSLWDADVLLVDRKTGDDRTIFVRSAAVSVYGTIQPGTLERAFDAELREAGTLARFVLAMPPSTPALWSSADLPEGIEDDYVNVVDALLSIPLRMDEDGDPAPRSIPLSEEAQSAFVDWHDRHAHETTDAADELSAAYAKIKGYCARFALILHLTKIAAHDPDADPTQITLPSMLSAIQLAEYFKAHARLICARIGEGDEDRDQRELVELISRRGGTITVRELTHNGPRGFRKDRDLAQAALDDLADAGHGYWEHSTPGPKGGRPSARFRLTAVSAATETPTGDVTPRGFGSRASNDNDGSDA